MFTSDKTREEHYNDPENSADVNADEYRADVDYEDYMAPRAESPTGEIDREEYFWAPYNEAFDDDNDLPF